MMIRLIDVSLTLFLLTDVEDKSSSSNDIHVMVSSMEKCFALIFPVRSFVFEHLHVGRFSDVKNRSVSLFVKSCSSFLYEEERSKSILFASVIALIRYSRKKTTLQCCYQ